MNYFTSPLSKMPTHSFPTLLFPPPSESPPPFRSIPLSTSGTTSLWTRHVHLLPRNYSSRKALRQHPMRSYQSETGFLNEPAAAYDFGSCSCPQKIHRARGRLQNTFPRMHFARLHQLKGRILKRAGKGRSCLAHAQYAELGNSCGGQSESR